MSWFKYVLIGIAVMLGIWLIGWITGIILLILVKMGWWGLLIGGGIFIGTLAWLDDQ